MNGRELYHTWLAPGIPHEQMPHLLEPSWHDLPRFSKCFQLFMPQMEFCNESFELLRQKYKEFTQKDIYNFKIFSPDPRFPLQVQLSLDLKRTIQKIRNDFGITYQREDEISDPVMEIFARTLIFASEHDLSYYQGFADMLVPFIHIVFYGFFIVTQGKPDMEMVESVAAHLFTNFLGAPPVQHFSFYAESIGKRTGPTRLDERVNSVIENLKERAGWSLAATKYSSDLKLCATKWFILIFSQDVKLDILLQIWDKLFESNPSKHFHDILAEMCFNAIVSHEEECKVKNWTDVLLIVQDCSTLTAKSIISPSKGKPWRAIKKQPE